MAQPSAFPAMAPAAPAAYPPLPNPVTVVGSQFLAAYPLDLAVVRKVMSNIVTEGNFAVTDINGNIIFKVKGKFMSLRDRRVMLDAAGNPLVTLRPKIMSVHDRWQVFRGESTEESDLLFTVRRSSMIQVNTKLHVFLANNTKEEVCDFRVEGSWLERSCVVYAGDSNTILAQMHKKHTVQSVLTGKDKFMLTVYHNVDYAFVVALIVVLDGIDSDSDDSD